MAISPVQTNARTESDLLVTLLVFDTGGDLSSLSNISYSSGRPSWLPFALKPVPLVLVTGLESIRSSDVVLDPKLERKLSISNNRLRAICARKGRQAPMIPTLGSTYVQREARKTDSARTLDYHMATRCSFGDQSTYLTNLLRPLYQSKQREVYRRRRPCESLSAGCCKHIQRKMHIALTLNRDQKIPRAILVGVCSLEVARQGPPAIEESGNLVYCSKPSCPIRMLSN
jgi:hypothetical protein